MQGIDNIRRRLQVAINAAGAERTILEVRYGQVWNASELARDFDVLEFAAPFAIVRRKTDDRLGSVLFQHCPRFYFVFQEDK
jgi:hypothetical protein